MPQLFPKASNTLARVCLAGLVLGGAGAAWASFRVYWSPLQTQEGVPIEQPVPFSHKHHVGGLGIDCRYCHTSVETSPFAGMPNTETCMTCHSQVWRDAPVLEPVRASWREGKPLAWVRVHDLPDYTYFDHHIHVAKGIACASCHGTVAEMPLTAKGSSLAMRWCLDCHQHPERAVRPREELFNAAAPAAAHGGPRPDLVKEYGINNTRLSDCSTCHR